MDQLREAVEAEIRRIALLGLMAIAAAVAALGHHPRLAMDAAAILVGLEAVALWRLADAAPDLPTTHLFGGRKAAWIGARGNDPRRRRMIADLAAESLRAWSRRLAVPAALVSAIDLAAHATR